MSDSDAYSGKVVRHPPPCDALTAQLPENDIHQWREAVLRSQAIDSSWAAELEKELRWQVAELMSSGLSGEEAFLVAVRRLGAVNRPAAEFAREHSDRLWKQLSLPSGGPAVRNSVLVMLGFAVLTAALVQTARVLANGLAFWFMLDISFFIIPILATYFAAIRRMPWRRSIILFAIVAIVAIVVNLFPFGPSSTTASLVALHLPFLLWFAVGAAYLGGDVLTSGRRMEFLRFSGEWVIYYALIALGGAVLMGLSMLVLTPLGAADVVAIWVLPSGIAGAVIVAAWLVEAKKSIVENLAPILAAVFTPLFAVMLVVAAVAYLVTGVWHDFDRELLAGFDALLLVVLGLVVYGISVRGSSRATGVMDVIRLFAVIAAIVLDVLVLFSMFTRVGEYGVTANRVVALGFNLILLVNLVVTAGLMGRVVLRRSSVTHLERWQTGYLAVFLGWFAVAVLVVPVVFGFA